MTTVRAEAGVGADRLVAEVFGGPGERSRWAPVLVPVAAVVGALAAGAVLMAVEGVAALPAYGEVVRGVVGRTDGLVATAGTATPLVLLALGITVAYRARVFTIGAPGQFVVGALAGAAWVAAAPVRGLPVPVLLGTGLVLAVLGGVAWAGVTGWLETRFGASVVLTGLLLNYVAAALLAWAVRAGIEEPPALPEIAGTGVRPGFLAALLAVPAVAVLLRRTRFGLRVEVLGADPGVLGATETRPARIRLAVLAVAGGFAGLAGFVEAAAPTGPVTPASAAGYGTTAIVVALLGRLRPVGVLVAGLLMAGLAVGFAEAERTLPIPPATVGVIQALVVVFVVAGDALIRRPPRRRS